MRSATRWRCFRRSLEQAVEGAHPVQPVKAVRKPRPERLLVDATALDVLLQPSTQPRPLTQQRLVGDLDLALVDGDQAGVREQAKHLGDALDALELGRQRSVRPAAPHGRAGVGARRTRPRRALPPRAHGRGARVGGRARRGSRRDRAVTCQSLIPRNDETAINTGVSREPTGGLEPPTPSLRVMCSTS
jgi:hypothetical protein